MKHEVTVPSPGESINEVFIGTWRKKTGDQVKKDEVLVDLETQKATFEIQAEHSGRIEVLYPQSETVVKPGDVIAIIDDSNTGETAQKINSTSGPTASTVTTNPAASPAARKMAAEKGIDVNAIKGTAKGGRITKEDVAPLTLELTPVSLSPAQPTTSPSPKVAAIVYHIDSTRGERRQPASRIRRQIAQNLVAAQHTAAILTTFNEVDMAQVVEFRKKNKDKLQTKYGISPGIVSFFAMASVRALKEFSHVNATFTGEDIILRDFVDLSVAMSTERGLVVPVVRDADKLTLIDFEKKVANLANKARVGRLSIPEMTGGTFTISNGGVFGSLLSTPLLNMPQSAILGLHKTQDRPVVLNGQIVVRPMMYLALSYDHRIIDGKEAVSFLIRIKEGIENLSLIINENSL